MTDSSAEPSSAAPAAAGDSDQGADESGQSRGLWTRLFDALSVFEVVARAVSPL